MTLSAVAPSPAVDLAHLAILLDIDGTILDVAPTPQSVQVPPGLPQTLIALWRRTGGALAFVSGRKVSDIDHIFTPLRLPAIGGHGAELRLKADGNAEAPRIPPLPAEIKSAFTAIADIGPGILVEDKGYSLALHYRLAPDMEEAVQKSAALICAALHTHRLELLPGKSMIEVKQTGFNKATAVTELMKYAPFKGRRPVFLGDDVTDLDVFAAMPAFGGVAISVGERHPATDHCFDRPADVRGWLEQISRTGILSFS
jgi:trehalose 6-phosphate phosphatase